MHGVDLAVATGHEQFIDQQLCHGLLVTMRAMGVDTYRMPGVFGSEVGAPEAGPRTSSWALSSDGTCYSSTQLPGELPRRANRLAPDGGSDPEARAQRPPVAGGAGSGSGVGHGPRPARRFE